MTFELTTEPKEEDAAKISRALMSFNRSSVKNLEPDEKSRSFHIFIRNDDGIIGGLRALCFWNTLHVELLWVSDGHRGRGLGSELLKKAEEYSLDLGFEQSLLETTDWQAKPFYEKQGYAVVASIDNYPKGHTCYFLTKQLK